ncbi:uncharacterized protein VP01_1243g4 [Puccinia sorghi]|uniref:Uncharacterized protein n=1 Tax=Puccinia sorghi TaxID=27349 RepID=A0A0L6VR27_9BASI|nr:uncharacterized protein VP01_1243g4 [Puccinia sorghi]
MKSQFASKILEVFQQHVHNTSNPDGDGNRGFRCILAAMEYSKNGWFWVQHELVKEMGDKLSISSKLFRGETKPRTLISQLKVSRMNEKIPPSKWLSKMDHKQAISNTFQRPVVFLSVEDSLSFIPTTTALETKEKTGYHFFNACQPKSLCLGALEGNQQI